MTAFIWNGSFPSSPSTGDTLVMNDITYTRTSLGTWEVTGGVAITETGALNSGSITSGFGSIDNGSSPITTTGALGAGVTTVTTFTSTGIDDNATSTALTLDSSQNATFAGDVTIDGETLLVNSPSTATDVAAIHFNGSATSSARYANISKMYDSPYTMKMQASNSAGESPLELWGSSDTMYLGFDISGNATFAGDINVGTLQITTAGNIALDDNDTIYFGTGNDVEFFCNGSHMYTDLNAGIGNWYIRDGSTTRFTFDDAGSFTATANITAYSDRKLKDNLEVIPNALGKVSQLTGYTYDRIDMNGIRQSGLIAQDVQEVLPEVIVNNVDPDSGEETLSVAYGNMIGLLVEAIKELKAEVEELKGK